jgi:hypothetical protein
MDSGRTSTCTLALRFRVGSGWQLLLAMRAVWKRKNVALALIGVARSKLSQLNCHTDVMMVLIVRTSRTAPSRIALSQIEFSTVWRESQSKRVH